MLTLTTWKLSPCEAQSTTEEAETEEVHRERSALNAEDNDVRVITFHRTRESISVSVRAGLTVQKLLVQHACQRKIAPQRLTPYVEPQEDHVNAHGDTVVLLPSQQLRARMRRMNESAYLVWVSCEGEWHEHKQTPNGHLCWKRTNSVLIYKGAIVQDDIRLAGLTGTDFMCTHPENAPETQLRREDITWMADYVHCVHIA